MNVLQKLSGYVAIMQECQHCDNPNDYSNWEDLLEKFSRENLPYGSGFDSGTTMNVDESNEHKIVLETSHHWMNDMGMYVGWSHHKIVVTPTFSGPDYEMESQYDFDEHREDVFTDEEYILDTIHYSLTKEIQL